VNNSSPSSTFSPATSSSNNQANQSTPPVNSNASQFHQFHNPSPASPLKDQTPGNKVSNHSVTSPTNCFPKIGKNKLEKEEAEVDDENDEEEGDDGFDLSFHEESKETCHLQERKLYKGEKTWIHDCIGDTCL
jgi:hypothetical protein